MTPAFTESIRLRHYAGYWPWMAGCLVLGVLGILVRPAGDRSAARQLGLSVSVFLWLRIGLAPVLVVGFWLVGRVALRRTIVYDGLARVRRLGYREQQFRLSDISHAAASAKPWWMAARAELVRIRLKSGARTLVPTRNGMELLRALGETSP